MIKDLATSLQELTTKLGQMSNELDNVLSAELAKAQGADRAKVELLSANIRRAKNKAMQGLDISKDVENLYNEHKNTK